MSRKLKEKDLENMHLATDHGGWMYCDHCHENIGYLCYVTYDSFQLQFECNCGGKGSCTLKFEDTESCVQDEKELMMVKNRYCCPHDKSPLFTILEKKLKNYCVTVVCTDCKKKFIKE